MKLPNTITFQGKTIKRPARRSFRQWKKPQRELGHDDLSVGFTRETQDGIYSISEGGPNEEGGYWSHHITIDFNDGTAFVECDGSDCDGRLRHFYDFAYINGEWVEENASQRDYTAEAMGY